MIDEKKLIEILRYDISCFEESENKKDDETYVRACDIISMIEGQPKIGEWIPCSERLPEKDGKYLVTYCDDLVENYVIERNFYNEKFEPMPYSEENLGRKAIAWQPLPAPYEVKTDE